MSHDYVAIILKTSVFGGRGGGQGGQSRGLGGPIQTLHQNSILMLFRIKF